MPMLFIVPSNKGQVFEESVNYSVIKISGKVGVKFNKSRVQDQECVYRTFVEFTLGSISF